jgi:hypothetical protein
MSILIWPVLFVVIWGVAWHFWFRPLLTKIQKTMGDKDANLLQRLEGAKTMLASFAMAIFAIVKSLLDALSSDTTVLDEVKTAFPWTTYVSADMALKIVAFFPLVIVFLHLYGKLKAALTTPVE